MIPQIWKTNIFHKKLSILLILNQYEILYVNKREIHYFFSSHNTNILKTLTLSDVTLPISSCVSISALICGRHSISANSLTSLVLDLLHLIIKSLTNSVFPKATGSLAAGCSSSLSCTYSTNKTIRLNPT